MPYTAIAGFFQALPAIRGHLTGFGLLVVVGQMPEREWCELVADSELAHRETFDATAVFVALGDEP